MLALRSLGRCGRGGLIALLFEVFLSMARSWHAARGAPSWQACTCTEGALLAVLRADSRPGAAALEGLPQGSACRVHSEGRRLCDTRWTLRTGSGSVQSWHKCLLHCPFSLRQARKGCQP